MWSRKASEVELLPEWKTTSSRKKVEKVEKEAAGLLRGRESRCRRDKTPVSCRWPSCRWCIHNVHPASTQSMPDSSGRRNPPRAARAARQTALLSITARAARQTALLSDSDACCKGDTASVACRPVSCRCRIHNVVFLLSIPRMPHKKGTCSLSTTVPLLSIATPLHDDAGCSGGTSSDPCRGHTCLLRIHKKVDLV